MRDNASIHRTDLDVGFAVVRLHVVVQRAVGVEQLLAGLDRTVGDGHVRVSPVEQGHVGIAGVVHVSLKKLGKWMQLQSPRTASYKLEIHTYEGGVDARAEAHIFDELPVSKLVCVLPDARLGVGGDEAVAKHGLDHVRVELEALQEAVDDAAEEALVGQRSVVS